MSVKRILSAFAATAIVLCSLVSVSTNAAEPEPAKKTVIDISTYNESVNWSVASKNIGGIIARIGYRGSVYRDRIVEDNMFYSHVSGALQYGVPFGVYFYSLALTQAEAVEEAEWVIARLKYYGFKPDMPVYIDVEERVQEETLTNRQRTDIILAFCNTMKDNGYYAGLYSNRYWLTNLLYPSEFDDYPVWVADYTGSCKYYGKYGMWQYTSTGVIDGIYGETDVSECYFDYPTFIKKYGYNGFTGIDEPPADSKDYSKRGTYKLSAAAEVRTGASDAYASLGTIENGAEVYVDYAAGSWGIIPFGTGTGWIKLGSSASRTSKYMTTQKNVGYYVVNTEVLNVRQGPSADTAWLSEMYYGNTVFISGVQGNWGWFYAQGGKRWICLDYAVFNGTVSFETNVSGKYIQPVRYSTGNSITLPKWNISMSDKIFSGWALTSGGEVKYADGASFAVGDSNAVLYAVCNSKNAYKFASKPKQAENGMAVFGGEGMSEADFMKKYISVSPDYAYKMKPFTGTFIGTGSEITFSLNGKDKDRLTVVIPGDCNGDGICDSLDLADALNISQGAKCPLTYSAAQKKAADVNLDGKADSADIALIKNAAFGTADLPE